MNIHWKQTDTWEGWRFVWYTGLDIQRMDPPGWRVCHFALTKLKSEPVEGVRVKSSDYHGFIIRFRYWLPWEKA